MTYIRGGNIRNQKTYTVQGYMPEPSFSKVNVELNSYKNAQLLKMLEQSGGGDHRRTSSQPEMDSNLQQF